MKRICFFCVFILTTVSSFSKIIEVKNFNSLKDYITPDTLVVLDIDDTLLITKQMLGCDEWFQARLKHYEQSLKGAFALERALNDWEGVRNFTSMELVEPKTDEVIRELQAQNVCIMGLTTQGLELSRITAYHLRENSIDLRKTAPSLDDHYFTQNGLGVLYRNGVLYTSGTPKGEALLKLCRHFNLKPKKIVFVNDKHLHLADIERAAEREGIEYIGLRYGYSDERKNRYSHETAEHQFHNSTFAKILNDCEVIGAFSIKTQLVP